VRNNIQYKQILIDIINYNALKDLGKTGDSFNKVIGNLLAKQKCEKVDSS
jgi:hypothetical protein